MTLLMGCISLWLLWGHVPMATESIQSLSRLCATAGLQRQQTESDLYQRLLDRTIRKQRRLGGSIIDPLNNLHRVLMEAQLIEQQSIGLVRIFIGKIGCSCIGVAAINAATASSFSSAFAIHLGSLLALLHFHCVTWLLFKLRPRAWIFSSVDQFKELLGSLFSQTAPRSIAWQSRFQELYRIQRNSGLKQVQGLNTLLHGWLGQRQADDRLKILAFEHRSGIFELWAIPLGCSCAIVEGIMDYLLVAA